MLKAVGQDMQSSIKITAVMLPPLLGLNFPIFSSIISYDSMKEYGSAVKTASAKLTTFVVAAALWFLSFCRNALLCETQLHALEFSVSMRVKQ